MNSKEMMFQSIAVIGAGLMGHGIAMIFALSGRRVWLNDLDTQMLKRAEENIRINLKLFVDNDLISADQVEPALAKINTTTSLKQAAVEADYVVEAISENLALKQSIFQELDKTCRPDTILSTNTSVISITEIAAKAKNRSRVVGTHFWNPPHLIPLVEVIPGDNTSPETVEKAFALLAEVGKHPVRVKRDVPGFVGNRLQHALWREAISIVDQGIAEPAVVDEVVKMGFGIRLPVLGPLENADLVGLELTHAIHDYILKYLDASPEPAAILKRKITEDCLGFKNGRGLQTWTEQEMTDTRNRLAAHLIQWNKANK